MKKFVVTLAVLFWMSTGAQEVSVQEFRGAFSYVLRVAEAPCPEQLRSAFPEGVCYRHGYANFFNFKEAVTSLLSGPDDYLEPWHVITLKAGGETVEAFKARYHLGEREITFTYVNEFLLMLEFRQVAP